MPENERQPEPGSGVSQPPPSSRHLDPRSLRGLAHPLRMRLLGALRHHGPATASQLAQRFGESSGATSYHLRQLAAHGFVEDDPERRGKGRERWWRAAHQGTAIDAELYDDATPETRGALNVLLHEIASIHGQELFTWVGTMHDWSSAWAKNADLSDYTLRLNPQQLGELTTELHALVQRYHERPAGEGAERVRVHLHAFPQHTDRQE